MISLNEGHNMEAVLRNLTGWAQEVFLVDSYIGNSKFIGLNGSRVKGKGLDSRILYSFFMFCGNKKNQIGNYAFVVWIIPF